MKDNYSRALARVLVYEGGKVDDPQDPGGRTNQGVTQVTYNAWRNRKGQGGQDVYLMTTAERDAIYKEGYWDRIHGDELPSGLDFCVFDAAVNSGIASASSWLQGALGIEVDGDFGPATLTASQDTVDHGVDAVIHGMCSRRLGSLQRLRTWGRFGKGWSARIANVQKTALSWERAGTSQGVHPAPVDLTSVGGNKKADLNDVIVSPISQVTAHVATAGSAVTTAAAQTATQLAPAVDVFSWLKYVLGGLTVVSALVGVAVMLSKQWNDAAQNATATARVDPGADENLPAVSLPNEVTVK
jgi:lysozyme family protein